MEPLSEEQVETRVAIIFGVDDRSCLSCGKAIPDGTASDPTWYVDAIGQPNGEFLAEILCPECW